MRCVEAGRPWRPDKAGVVVRVRVTPNAARDGVAGVGSVAGGPAVLARVRAAPEKGAANAALERLIADWIGVPRSAVSVERGGRSRIKSVRVSGTVAVLEHSIAALVAALGAGAGRGP